MLEGAVCHREEPQAAARLFCPKAVDSKRDPFCPLSVWMDTFVFLWSAESERKGELLLDGPSVIPVLCVEMSPLPPGWAAKKHICTVCDYSSSPTFNSVSSDFIYVGCETFSRGYAGMLGERMDVMLEAKRTCSHAPALQGRLLWVASQKGPHARPEYQRRVRK